jgi:hypothetical protein
VAAAQQTGIVAGSEGSTALLLAVQHRQPLVALFLLDKGADVQARDGNGCTAAHWAAYNDDLQMLRILLAHGCMLVEPLPERGEGPAAVAVGVDESGAEERGPLLDAVVAYPAVPDPIRDRDGLTALHRAVRGGALQTTRFLIEDIDAGWDRGYAAASVAQLALGTHRARSVVDRAVAWLRPPLLFDPRDASGRSSSSSAAAAGTTGAGAVTVYAELSALGHAEDTLRVMLSSAEAAGGTFASAAGHGLMLRQKALVEYLQTRVDELQARDASLRGLLMFHARRMVRPGPLRFRVVNPLLFLGLWFAVAHTWWNHLSATSGGFMVSWVFAALLVALVTFARLYMGSTGALDPCAALGDDQWPRTAPWHWLNPAHGLLPLLRPHANGRSKPTLQREASAPVANLAAQMAADAVAPAASTAATGPHATKDESEVDYLALVEQMMGGSDDASTATAPQAAPSATASLPELPLGPPAVIDESVVHSPFLSMLTSLRTQIADLTQALGDAAAVPPFLIGRAPPQAVQRASASSSVVARICYDCELVRPLRAAHDPQTGRCYDRYDSFFTWSGTPIAWANHRIFIGFFISVLLASIGCFISLWTYLGMDAAAFLVTSGRPMLYSLPSPELSEETYPSRFRLLFTSWTLVVFLTCAMFGYLRASAVLRLQAEQISANLTVFERAHRGDPDFAHFRALKLTPRGQVEPAFVNPFDHGKPVENMREFLGLRGPKTGTSPAALASRALENTEEITALLLEHQRALLALRGNASAATTTASSESVAVDVPSGAHSTEGAAPASGNGHSHGGQPCDGHGHGASAALAATDGEPEDLEVDSDRLRARVLALRASFAAFDSWPALQRDEDTPKGGHGHSHAGSGGGHGHSHGGSGGGHGHSHGGGGGGHGHSHGGARGPASGAASASDQSTGAGRSSGLNGYGRDE